MMIPVDDPPTQQHASETEHGKASNEHDEADNQQTGAPQVHRGRAQSDAARRNERESQRATHHEEKSRLSLLNNRFLARKESRATSGDAKPGGDAPTRGREKASPLRKQPRRQPEDDDDHKRENEDDDEPKRRIVEESALVVTRRRSSAASSAATKEKAKLPQGGRGSASPRQQYDDAIVLTPSVHMIPSLALKRSKWTRELDEDATCGLYVEDERRELEQIASSTLVRLEERLQREQQEGGSKAKTKRTTKAIRLNDLLHVPRVEKSGITTQMGGSYSNLREALPSFSQRRRKQAWTLATLEITIDRLIIDDHLAFSLADRIETQLRSLCVSYTHLLHAQPWGPLQQRIDTFVESRLLQQSNRNPQEDCRWLAQTQLNAQSLLQSMGTLQQLHYQLLTKWHELQDCYRQPALPSRSTKLRIRHEKRAVSLTLSSMRAFLELHDGSDDQNSVRAKLEKKLEELETKDQYLHTVLVLEAFAADPVSERSRHRYQHTRFASCWPGMLSMGSVLPRFYVALFINDKEVGRTKPVSWSTHGHQNLAKPHVGVVPIRETLRMQLRFFPESVAVKVYERGLVIDTLLSTTSIPLLVPGHDLVGSGSLSESTNRVAAASLAPSVEWYQFSSVNAMPRSRWHPTFLNSSLFANLQRHPHGRVRAQVSWVDGITDESLHRSDVHGNQVEHEDHGPETAHIVLPLRRLPVAAGDTAQLVGPRVDRRRLYRSGTDDVQLAVRNQDPRHASFSYERDFLDHIADPNRDAQLAVDRNDPQNASVVRLQDHVRTQSSLLKERDVFRAASLVYDATVLLSTPSFGVGRSALTRRNLLLQLRDREHVAKHGTSMIFANATEDLAVKKWDHSAFDEPLPLSEHAITTNAKFLTLMRPEIPAFDYRQRLDDALTVDGASRFSIERERKLQLLKLQDFVGRVRASHLARVHNKALASSGKQRDRTKTLATIIQEQPMPLLPGAIDFSGLGDLFSRRRRLRPRVETRTLPATMADWPRYCTLYVQIKGATNVPVRMQTRRSVTAKPKAPTNANETDKRRRGGASTDDDDDEVDRKDFQRPEAPLDPADSGHVFVEISFQGRRRRTSSTHVRATGAVWMETVALPFNAPQEDWSPDSLQKSSDVVRLNLFDQLVRTSSSEGGDDIFLMPHGQKDDAGEHLDDQAQHQRRVQSFHQENRFLGSLEIPFTTLYHNHGTLDATLRCETPIVNLGYVNAKHSSSGNSDSDQNDGPPGVAMPNGAASVGADRDDDGVVQGSRDATFLSVMMTLDPLLPMPTKSYEDNPLSAGDDYAALAAYALHWRKSIQSMNTATKHRDFHVFVRSLGHGQTFLTRYLSQQMPPSLLDSSNKRVNQTTISQLVRYVHLIPYLDDWQLFDDGGELDVWTTSQELLELNAGDFEEHAVLLCNFFNWLDRDEANRESFLVLATSVPEGKTVYVLRQDSYKIPQRTVLWNASTGIGYSVLDDRCPVLDISLVVSSENVYANIQPGRRLSEMDWNIESNAKAWKPFFYGSHKKEAYTLPTVQTYQLTYADTSREYVQQVEVELREALKLEIRRWRSIKYTTTFNMDLSMKLRTELEKLELKMLNGVRGSAAEVKRTNAESTTKDPIQELQKTRRVSGLPLNSSFTDMSKVITMVKNTNIYWNDHSEVEFGLAVYVHAYPNCVLSVWVYLVAVEPIE